MAVLGAVLLAACGGTTRDLCANVTCTAQDACHQAGVCEGATGKCTNPAQPDGTACDDHNANTSNDKCTAGVCAGTVVVDLCVGVTCTAKDICHVAGVCDHPTGVCSNPNATDGTACDDHDANTSNDHCTAGVCTGTAVVDLCAGVTCAAADDCHTAGVCDSATGVCSNPNATNGTACDDHDANTTNDVCTAGICAGVDRCAGVTCTADQCHAAGTCDHATGTCSSTNQPDGTACDDGNANTTGDHCTAGVCGGTVVVDLCVGVTCAAPAACHQTGVCQAATGTCTFANVSDGASCNDGNANTVNDKCTAGVCAGTDLCAGVSCAAADACHLDGACNHADGTCSVVLAPDDTVCD
ncbi:MAG: hypothetical protein JST92_24765, partial [Deltaproteobacteria bacterium]|nr:hypothetical protein [Deltaproteobacteria bacterium]